MQRRLELACTLVHSPLLIFADEPTAGVDPVLRGKFWDHFRQLRDQNRTFVVTTQYVGEALYCDMVGIMREGRLNHIDTPENLRRKAFGGEIVQLVVHAAHALDAAQLFQRHPAIRDVRRSRSQPGLVYLYVDDASEKLPLIFQVMNDHPEITVQQAEKYMPPFDEVFIQLMEQAGNANV
jgi:ABC-2 type transport system ATP-binding protein